MGYLPVHKSPPSIQSEGTTLYDCMFTKLLHTLSIQVASRIVHTGTAGATLTTCRLILRSHGPKLEETNNNKANIVRDEKN